MMRPASCERAPRRCKQLVPIQNLAEYAVNGGLRAFKTHAGNDALSITLTHLWLNWDVAHDKPE